MAKNDNRALIIVGHSWGSAMSYKALEELGSEVKVDSFITMGSPLNADNVAVKKFTDSKFKEKEVEVIPSTTALSTPAAIIEKPLKIEKPKGVDKWINYWANGDIISGSIPSADRNIQIDKGKETLSSSQRYTLPTSGLGLAVVKTATEKWHSAYYDNNEWKEDIAVNMTSAMIRHEVKTAASNESIKKQAVSNILPIAKSDAVKIIQMPKNLPMNLPLGKVSDTSKLRETTGQEKLTPVDVKFTQTLTGFLHSLPMLPAPDMAAIQERSRTAHGSM